jgi:hypothetical protein
MTNQTPIATNAANTNPLDAKSLDHASDETLTELIERAQHLLAARETERKRAAIAQIKELARANGLDVAIEPARKKRGRKPKTETI